MRRVPSYVSQIVLLNHGNHAWLPQFELAAYKVSALVVPKDPDDPEGGGDSLLDSIVRYLFRGD